MRTLLKGTILAILITALSIPTVMAQRPEPQKTEIGGHTMYTVLKPGDIPAIFDPMFVSVADAESTYYDDEPMLVVTGNGIAKAYSTWHLDQHEVVNDYIDGRAITVTW